MEHAHALVFVIFLFRSRINRSESDPPLITRPTNGSTAKPPSVTKRTCKNEHLAHHRPQVMRRKIFVFGIIWLALLRHAFATSQLIVNGGFESPSAFPWVLEGAGAQIISGTGAYDGSQYLSMGNGFGPNQYVYQTVTFPTNLIGATLSLANETFSTD